MTVFVQYWFKQNVKQKIHVHVLMDSWVLQFLSMYSSQSASDLKDNMANI